METSSAVIALSALAQENRLDVFRLLVQAGPGGLAAGDVADRLEIAPATLSFHLAQLRQAGLLSMRRDGRSLIYSANYDGMNALMAFLTENCCRGSNTSRGTGLRQTGPAARCRPGLMARQGRRTHDG